MAGQTQYDVIVVGAGPAGALAAYQLARRGCRVLLLEREKIPRYKTCGGGVVKRALDALPFPLDGLGAVVERSVSRFELTHTLKQRLSLAREPALVAMTMRSAFDEFLTRKAVEAGALLNDRVSVETVVESGESVRCDTTAGSFVASFLIGADGANSIVARRAGWFRPPRCGIALEAELYVRSDRLLADYATRADFDFNVLPQGYGWVFPKADHLSVGVFTLRTSLPGIQRYCDAYIVQKGLASQVVQAVIKGHRIPLGPRSERFNSQRVLLAGDAAGLADPLTGEGISYAIRSGLFAGEAVLATLRSPACSLDTYSQTVRDALLPDIKLGARWARLLYGFPWFFYRLLTRKQLLAERLADVFEGKTTYRQLWRDVYTKPYKLF